MLRSRHSKWGLALMVCGLLAVFGAAARSAQPKQIDFTIKSQPLAGALQELAKQSDIQIIFLSKVTDGIQAPAIIGRYTVDAALRQLLHDSRLSYRQLNSRTIEIQPLGAGAEGPASDAGGPSSGLHAAQAAEGAGAASASLTNAGQPADAAPAQSKLAGAATSPEDQTEAFMLQEVVVTAQKREEKLRDVPMGVTAITSGDLQTQRLLDFEDLESKVPGLSVQLSFPGFDRLTIRGENVGGNGSTVGTYLDDVPFGSSSTFAQGQYLSGDFATWDLQRVEVLRGPQGTLYGASSEGGLLKYVTNPPALNGFASAFELGAENVAHGQTGPSYKAMVNLPVGGIAAFRLDGYFSHLPGYIDNTQLGETDVNRGYREGGRVSFLLQPTDNFSIRLTAFEQTEHSDGLPIVDVVGAAGTPLTPPANQLQPVDGNYDQKTVLNQPSTSKFDIYSGTINWNLGWSTLTSVTGYEKIEQDLFVDETPEFGALAGILLPPGTKAAVADSDDSNLKKYTEEVRLASPAGGTLEWQVGAFYTHESSTLPQSIPILLLPTLAQPPVVSPLIISDLAAVYREWAAFGQIIYHFSPAFDVALGGRWSENKQSENDFTGGFLLTLQGLPSGTTTQASTGSDFLYSVAPRWHLSPNTMSYARVATGYRPGGPNQGLPSGTPGGVERHFKSDSTINYEVGIKSSLLDNRLSVDLAAFLIDWKDIQLEQAVGNFGFTANGGSATSRGLEWSLGLTPLNGLNLTLTGAYVDAYLTADAPKTGGVNGDELPYAPKWSGSLDAAYTWKAFAGYNAFAGATWSYIGSRAPDFGATATPTLANPYLVEPDPRADLGSYNTINLRAGLDNGRWSFELYCKNLTDSRGVAYYVSSSAPNFEGEITLQQPRTVGAAIDLRF